MSKTLFTPVTRQLNNLLDEVISGRLGLPELQRGYVWPAKKVRDLLDSMMKGYPVGYLMIWEAADSIGNTKRIGTDSKVYETAKSLIIDGQQRICSLYSVMCGKKITDEKYQSKPVVISFNALTRAFAVADNATKRAADWIYDISVAYQNVRDTFRYIPGEIARIAEARERIGNPLGEKDKNTIGQNISDLLALYTYSIPTLEINRNTDEESVADIFVRVNSGATPLGENDFILTLISLYWQEGRNRIEDFCRAATIPKEGTPYNFLFRPSPKHIVRVVMCFGFDRARLYYAYRLLREAEHREENFEKLKDVIDQVLHLANWKGFLQCVEAAGYVSPNILSSENALVYSYAMYLIIDCWDGLHMTGPEYILGSIDEYIASHGGGAGTSNGLTKRNASGCN